MMLMVIVTFMINQSIILLAGTACNTNIHYSKLTLCFRCFCDNGFTGDGFNCTDINECSDEPNLCENGACINSEGSFSCDCQNGFMHPAEEYSQVHVCNVWAHKYVLKLLIFV